jgi:hypothetical protein
MDRPNEEFKLRASDLNDMGWPEEVRVGQRITQSMLDFAKRRIADGWKRPDAR